VTKKMAVFWEEGGSRFLWNIKTHPTTQHHTPEDIYFDFTKLSQCIKYSHKIITYKAVNINKIATYKAVHIYIT